MAVIDDSELSTLLEIAERSEKLVDDCEHWQNKCKDFEKVVDKLTHELSDSQTEIKKLKNEVNNRQVTINDLMSKIVNCDKYKNECNRLKSENHDLKIKIDRLTPEPPPPPPEPQTKIEPITDTAPRSDPQGKSEELPTNTKVIVGACVLALVGLMYSAYSVIDSGRLSSDFSYIPLAISTYAGGIVGKLVGLGLLLIISLSVACAYTATRGKDFIKAIGLYVLAFVIALFINLAITAHITLLNVFVPTYILFAVLTVGLWWYYAK